MLIHVPGICKIHKAFMSTKISLTLSKIITVRGKKDDSLQITFLKQGKKTGDVIPFLWRTVRGARFCHSSIN